MHIQNYKISIVIAIYDVERYLDKCIQSVRKQTYKDIEIILVVRDSGDRCVDICETHKAEDDRIVVIKQKGKGLVNARKIGTLSATGRYILHIDGDDWMESGRVQGLVKYLQKQQPDMIYLSGLVIEGKTTERLLRVECGKEYFKGEEVCHEIFPMFMKPERCFDCGDFKWSLSSWAIKKELLLQQQMMIDDQVIMCEDAICTFLCLIRAKSVAIIQTASYHYLVRDGSGMRTPISIKDGNLEIVYKTLKENFKKCDTSYDLNSFLVMFTNYVILMWEYKYFSPCFKDFLYPYSKVVSGSKVVVYGAGRFGRQVLDALTENENYSLVMWCDRNINAEPYGNFCVQAIDNIVNVEYDYVVVAVLKFQMALEIRNGLVEFGIPNEKIALLDASVISEQGLQW